jgi:hypothetical protein
VKWFYIYEGPGYYAAGKAKDELARRRALLSPFRRQRKMYPAGVEAGAADG